METEIWLPVAKYLDYEVSNLGNVRSHKGFYARRDKVLKPWLNKHTGYLFVSLHGPGGQHNSTVHSLVCSAFCGAKPEPGFEVAHWDGDKQNNRAENLRWALPIDNHADKRRHGTHVNSGQFKPLLSPEEVREIRRLLAEGWKQHAIAAKFGIWQTAVSHIKTGKRWKHLC